MGWYVSVSDADDLLLPCGPWSSYMEASEAVEQCLWRHLGRYGNLSRHGDYGRVITKPYPSRRIARSIWLVKARVNSPFVCPVNACNQGLVWCAYHWICMAREPRHGINVYRLDSAKHYLLPTCPVSDQVQIIDMPHSRRMVRRLLNSWLQGVVGGKR